MSEPDYRVLLIDTCGESAGVALSVGERTVAERDLEAGRASAEIVGAVRELLMQAGWGLADLSAVGVVSGPGSFTGTRTGLAAAKGICEGAGLPLIAVSRLAVLADAGGVVDAVAALDAGRGECYVRDGVGPREFLCKVEELAVLLQGRRLVVAEARLLERIGAVGVGGRVELRPLHVGDALPLVLRALRSGEPTNGVLAEANYVRGEQDIYSRTAVSRTAVSREAGK